MLKCFLTYFWLLLERCIFQNSLQNALYTWWGSTSSIAGTRVPFTLMFQLFEKTSAEVHWLKISFRVVWYLSRKQDDHKTGEDGKRSRWFPSCPDVSLWCRISHVSLPVTKVHWIRHLGLKNGISKILKWQCSFNQNKEFKLKSWIRLSERTSKFDQKRFFFFSSSYH